MNNEPFDSSSSVPSSRRLRLRCVIECQCQPVVFTVEEPCSTEICDLKEVIQQKRAQGILKDVGPHTLHLWKPKDSNPIPVKPAESLAEHIKSLGDSISEVADELDPVDTLFSSFPNQPPKEHIHIIVKVPATDEWDIAPRELDIEGIDEIIDKELKSLRGDVETFLKNPEPPIWVPPDHVTPNNREFLTNLQIPSYDNGNPSILFHNLDVCDGNEIEKIFGRRGNTSVHICNTSGSGKTRRMLEGLTKYWGFYLVAVRDPNGVGVRDLHDALEDINLSEGWMPDLCPLPPVQRANQNDVNRRIVFKHLQKVLAARIVVFRLFLELAIQVDGNLQEKHKRIWLLFQLSDRRGGDLHPFVRIMRHCLRHASYDALDILVGRLHDIREVFLPQSQFIIGLDEAQHAARMYPNSFISCTDNRIFRSIIREMVTVFTRLSIKLVVAGTDLLLGDLTDAIPFSPFKPIGVEVFHELGMFDTWPKLKPFIERYVPASILESPSGYRLQLRIREYLQGRYRFSVSFLEYFLRNGLESPHRLLNDFIKEHTACVPGDTGDPFASHEPEIHVPVRLLGFDWVRLQRDSAAIQDAVQIVQSHLTKGQSPTFGPVTTRLVENGLARLRLGDMSRKYTGHIVEPLAFLSLMKWLEKQNYINLGASRLGFQASRANDYEEQINLYLLRMLRYPVPFNAIFNFHSTPVWENEMAHIIGRLNVSLYTILVDILGGAPQSLGLDVVYYAASIEEVIDWLENPAVAPAVLVTSHLFGPAVMMRCSSSPSNSTATSTVLLMGQFKSFTDGNKESLDTGTISHDVASLNRDHWYKQEPSHLRQKLIDAIEKHRVLRFLGGYRLPPNLNSTATSVVEALDPNVPLATIELDAFRAHFISESEC